MTQANWRHFDFWLLGAVALLTIFGITMINSTIAGNIEVAQAAQRQLIFAVLGFVLLFVIAAIDYHLWQSIERPLYWGTVIVLAVLNVVGNAVFGSARWFRTALIYIQPSELAKVVVILTISAFLARNMHKIKQLDILIRSGILMFGIVIWIILQPNLSTSIVVVVSWTLLLFASGFPIRKMLLSGVVLMAILAISFPILVRAEVIQDYQLRRIESFINPDPEARHGDSYNLDQAQISIGSGGWLGQGYQQGTQVQLRFLKVRWSDFIFSSLAHEFGFAGTVIMMLLEIFVVYRCLHAARIARDTFGGLLAFGVAVLLAFQGMVNIGVNLRLLPATGLPLPFISYGGSSLFSLLVAVGLVESVILRHKSLEF